MKLTKSLKGSLDSMYNGLLENLDQVESSIKSQLTSIKSLEGFRKEIMEDIKLLKIIIGKEGKTDGQNEESKS